VYIVYFSHREEGKGGELNQREKGGEEHVAVEKSRDQKAGLKVPT
jgi:hypothetical protein